MAGKKKRFWADEEKVSICAQTTPSGVSVAQVALRYSMNANLIHKWLRDPRFAPASEDNVSSTEQDLFLPVEIEGGSASNAAELPVSNAAICATRVDITLSDGRRVLVEGPTALSSILGLIEGLRL